MNNYEQKKADRIDRMRNRAQKLTAAGLASVGAARATASQIPFGQPILVGHHSEKRHRRDIERIDARYRLGFEALEEGKRLEARADAAESNAAISSDDPDAISKLEAKLVELKATHAREVAGNKAIRAANGDHAAATQALLALGFTPTQVSRALIIDYGSTPYGFFVRNTAATVRATEKRIAELRAKQATPEREPLAVGDARMTWDKSENRVRIAFLGKPDEATRGMLKASGFRWAPSADVWQRQASEGAWRSGAAILRALHGEKA